MRTQRPPPGTRLPALLLGTLMATTVAQAASFGDYLKQLGSFSFGGSEFNPADMAGHQKQWEDRERWVKEALDQAYLALARQLTLNCLGY